MRLKYSVLISSLGLVLLLSCCSASRPENCISVDETGDKIVCVCDENKCDWLSYEFPTKSASGHLIESTRAGERFKVTEVKFEASSQAHKNGSQSDDQIDIELDLDKRYQSILGWGGAFTDAFGFSVTGLSDICQENLMKSYFGADGIRYNFGRVHIGGCDFSVRSYSLDDLPPGQVDYDLSNWGLAYEDLHYKIPLIRIAQKMRLSHSEDGLKLFGTPWSPPAWMKDNHDLTRGHLIDDPKIYQAYADYIVKFYTSYKEKLGFDFWGGTLQNEPASAQFPSYFFNSLQLGIHQAQVLVGQYLGPSLERHGLTKDNFKLMVGDDNLDLINYQVPAILADKQVQKYVSGLAFHWYSSGWQVPYDRLTDCIDEIHDKVDFVLMTEACAGWKKGQEIPVDLGSWERGELYAIDIIQDVLRMSAGWVDWNMALGQDGGPNWVNNTVDSPIIVNKDSNQFYKQPMFYILGHFSRFFLPGAIRVETTPTTKGYKDLFMTVAVINPKQDVVAINMLNRFDTERTVNLNVKSNSKNLYYTLKNVRLAAKSMSTITLKL